VKISLTMEEQSHHHQAPSTFRIKSGVSKDGRIVARDCEVGGTAAPMPPSGRGHAKSGFTAPDRTTSRMCRSIPHALYTNLPPAGSAARLRHPAAGLA